MGPNAGTAEPPDRCQVAPTFTSLGDTYIYDPPGLMFVVASPVFPRRGAGGVALGEGGRPGQVATQALQLPAIPGGDGDVGVQAHAAVADAAGREGGAAIDLALFLGGGLHPVAQAVPGTAGLGTRGDAGAEGGGGERGKEGFVAGEGVVLFVAEAAPGEGAEEAAGGAGEHRVASRGRVSLGPPRGQPQWPSAKGHREWSAQPTQPDGRTARMVQ